MTEQELREKIFHLLNEATDERYRLRLPMIDCADQICQLFEPKTDKNRFMTEQLREKIAKLNCEHCAKEPPNCDRLCKEVYDSVDQILALIKEAGIEIDANAQMEYWNSQFDKFAKNRGYVKLAEKPIPTERE